MERRGLREEEGEGIMGLVPPCFRTWLRLCYGVSIEAVIKGHNIVPRTIGKMDYSCPSVSFSHTPTAVAAVMKDAGDGRQRRPAICSVQTK